MGASSLLGNKQITVASNLGEMKFNITAAVLLGLVLTNGAKACPRIPGWCVHAGASFSLKDCDGDGVRDPTCSDNQGQFGIISSADNCRSIWPNARCGSSCPRTPGWCVHAGASFSLKDCDG